MNYPLSTLYFYLTEGCNLACRHCWIAPKFQDKKHVYPMLDFKLFCSIIEQAKLLGLSTVKLTGGEPLLHPEISEILKFIRQENINLHVETNGVLCTSELAQELARAKGIFVGVSLDGTDAQTHEWVRGVEGCFDAALEGIRNLVKAEIRPQIIMTIMQRNKDQIEKIVHLAESLGAGSVKFNILQPTARGEKMHALGETLSVEELVRLGEWVENMLAAKTALRLHYDRPLVFRPFGKMFSSSGSGCSVCGILGILGVLADGSYALCGIGESIPEFVFGYAAEDKLEEVWNNTGILRDLRAGLPNRLEGVCRDCMMKNRCRGSCIAQNYYTSHNLWAGFWYCEEAKKHGLFPKTRLLPGNKLDPVNQGLP